MVDFGSYTTRVGYAGEDCPRVVCPSFYGYVDAPEGSNGESSIVKDGDVSMDGSNAPIDGANGMSNGEGKRKGRKYYVGEDGVGVWRPAMEVDNFMVDGIGQ